MTNDQMSALASAYVVPHSADELKAAVQFFRDIRKLAASCLAQDQVKGQGK